MPDFCISKYWARKSFGDGFVIYEIREDGLGRRIGSNGQFHLMLENKTWIPVQISGLEWPDPVLDAVQKAVDGLNSEQKL